MVGGQEWGWVHLTGDSCDGDLCGLKELCILIVVLVARICAWDELHKESLHTDTQ